MCRISIKNIKVEKSAACLHKEEKNYLTLSSSRSVIQLTKKRPELSPGCNGLPSKRTTDDKGVI
jgi:hypothetical protein